MKNIEEEKVKSFDNLYKITCPHCGYEQGYEPCDDYGLITCWGEESIEMECFECEKKFFIQERVIRDWEVAKDYNDF